MDFTTFFKKKIEPFIAVGVLIIVIIICFQLYNGLQLREEINQNCGWEDEDYRCFCEKSDAMAIMNIIEDFDFTVDEEIEYVQMAG